MMENFHIAKLSYIWLVKKAFYSIINLSKRKSYILDEKDSKIN